jgi:peptidoglycan hydrolase CwlO-like protein
MEKRYLVIFAFAVLLSLSFAFLINNVMAAKSEDSAIAVASELDTSITEQQKIMQEIDEIISMSIDKGIDPEIFEEFKELLEQAEKNGQEIAEKARQIGSHNGRKKGKLPPIVNPGY